MFSVDVSLICSRSALCGRRYEQNNVVRTTEVICRRCPCSRLRSLDDQMRMKAYREEFSVGRRDGYFMSFRFSVSYFKIIKQYPSIRTRKRHLNDARRSVPDFYEITSDWNTAEDIWLLWMTVFDLSAGLGASVCRRVGDAWRSRVKVEIADCCRICPVYRNTSRFR